MTSNCVNMAGSYAATATPLETSVPGRRAPLAAGATRSRQCALLSPLRLGAGGHHRLAVSSRHRDGLAPSMPKTPGGLAWKATVAVNPAREGSLVEVELVATNTGSSSLSLHWGALQQGRREWVLPSRRPDGTRTPLSRLPSKACCGTNSSIKIEIDDPAVESIEFVIVDEAQNKWFKNNDQNFQIHLRKTDVHQGQHSATAETRRHSAERIVRKNRDAMQLLSKPAASHDKDSCNILCKKFFKLGEKEILALFLEEQGRAKVQLATNYAEQLILHWALAQKAGEWKAPPAGIVPPGSTLLEMACKSSFSEATFDGLGYQDGTEGGKETAKALLETIADLEEDAQRSLMHRFNIAADLAEQAKDAGHLGLSGLLVWMRFMATRQLVWNKNYNVKPREISQAQDRFTDILQNLYKTHPQYRETIRMIMSAVGRGGEGDALMDYLNSNLDIKVYWDTLNKNGITKERLLSYDHPIHSEPNLKIEQKDGLLRDLTNYMRSLKAVHSGADLESSIGTCTGYRAEELLKFVMEHIDDKSVEALVEALLEARAEIRPLLCGSSSRLKDLIFLDIALDSTVRTAVERSYEQLNNAALSLVLENLALSTEDNENLLCCLKGWNQALGMAKNSDNQWALYAKACLDRTRLALVTKGEEYHQTLQPSAEYLGSLLGVEQWTVNIFTEEIIRSGSAASLSLLLNRLDPVLRNIANLGSWQIISPVEVIGYVTAVDELLTVQKKSYDIPTVLVAKAVRGEEEIPDGVVAVLTPDMPDVLSHVSVRARNSKVLFATCFDPEILSELQHNEGKLISMKPTSTDITYRETAESEFLVASSPTAQDDQSGPSISLVKKQFPGKYAISADEMSLKKKLNQGEFSALNEMRHAILNLIAPVSLVKELKEKMQGCGMPWPGDEGEQRWEQAWMAIKKVWASKWNERAYFSTRKVKLDHDYLSMAVLVQEIVLGYPSKPIGLFIKQSIIFRSDSNGEDLEGYAGAGLYDSVPMDKEEEVVLDYTTDPLIIDCSFRNSILSSIARTGYAIEELYGSPQDIEGVVKDGKIYIVQTRPQM
ncbi:hypothetical protein PR202_gb08393 [Eleusine coracana subsp. coracana]|uniref:alpha-glucan, water dikinase n=1 Tax=Eleusine coracana subsp. coracana TaxID=191504 RepID=A0AAV5EEJ3_ELECO|nr:hypothetical protein PR202_gb08393 [Eleusine coracana subsp. coracana]